MEEAAWNKLRLPIDLMVLVAGVAPMTY